MKTSKVNFQTSFCFAFLDELEKSCGFFEKYDNLSNKISKLLTIYISIFGGIIMLSLGAISMLYCYITRGSIQADHLFVAYKVT